MLFLYAALYCFTESAAGTQEAGDKTLPPLEHLTGREEPAGEAICWALGQAVGTDLSSFLGQEGILHPPLALDFSEGWPI